MEELGMNRGFHAAILLAIGMALGYALSSYQRTDSVAAAQAAPADDQNMDVMDELKGIRAEAKEIKLFLKSGKLIVTAPIYPDAGRR
jgi:hypothetical protein